MPETDPPHDDPESADTETAKEEYDAPELTVWGSVREITATGKSNPGTDKRGGSVNPPGRGPPGDSGPPDDTPGRGPK
jgi:hypothetical protein